MPLPKAILVEDKDGQVHDQAFFEWVPHFCQKYQVIGQICPKNKGFVKDVKKSTTRMLTVPKQGTVEQIVIKLVVGGTLQSEPFNVEEKDWVQVNKRKKVKEREVWSEAGSSCESQPSLVTMLTIDIAFLFFVL